MLARCVRERRRGGKTSTVDCTRTNIIGLIVAETDGGTRIKNGFRVNRERSDYANIGENGNVENNIEMMCT